MDDNKENKQRGSFNTGLMAAAAGAALGVAAASVLSDKLYELKDLALDRISLMRGQIMNMKKAGEEKVPEIKVSVKPKARTNGNGKK